MNPRIFENRYLIAVLLSVVAVLLYLQLIHTDFILYDDPNYFNSVSANTKGFWHTLVWAFTSIVNDNWSPVTILSLCVDFKLYGLNSHGYHFTNILIHALNSALVFLVVLAILKDRTLALLIALIFVAHPLNVEAVAWISERKGILSTFFALLSILAFMRFRDSKKYLFYFLAMLAFLASLMSKAVYVVVPLLFILIDWYRSEDSGEFSFRESIIRSLPFLVASFLFGLFTIYVHETSGAIVPTALNPFGMRMSNGLNSFIVYIEQFFYPVNLYAQYRYVPIATWKTIINIPAILLIFYFSIKYRKKKPYILFGLLWYTICLLPVSGIIQSGYHAHADRYVYLALTGISLICILAVRDALKNYEINKTIRVSVVVIIFMTMAFMNLIQQKYWFNTLTLFKHVYLADPENYIALTNISRIYILNKDTKKGMLFYRKVEKLTPNYTKMYENVINDLLNVDKPDLAVEVAKDYLRNNNNDPNAYLRIVKLYLGMHKYEQAINKANLASSKGLATPQMQYLLVLAYHLNKQDDKAQNYLHSLPKAIRSSPMMKQLSEKLTGK